MLAMIAPRIPGNRMEPPSELSDEQKAEWLRITAELPSSWFTAENVPLLAQLCRHITYARYLAGLIEIDRGLPPDQWDWERLKDLLAAHRGESGAMVQLSTKLRLTNQSRYIERRTPENERKKVGTGPKPWLDWRERPQ
jgi:hypothetical protein